jgi:hypothetical protein
MDEYEEHRIKAPKLVLPYLNLFLYTSLVLSHAARNAYGFMRATGTIEAAGFHTLIRIFSVVPIISF